MFWIKPSEINVDCFTFNDTAYTNFAPERSSKFYPKEIKNLDNNINIKTNQDPTSKLTSKLPTIRMCNGLTDLYSNGFILPIWQNLTIECTSEGKIFYEDLTSGNGFDRPALQVHDRWQYGNNFYSEFGHVKLLSHWFFKEKHGIQFSWNMCDWNRTDIAHKVRILSGVIDFKYQTATNVNMFIKKDSIISYEAGDPLVHLIPLSEKRVKIHKHILHVEEYDKLTTIQGSKMTYHNHRKLKDQSEAKCPFGFGK